MTDAANPAIAAAFVEYVLSDEGQRVLAGLGLRRTVTRRREVGGFVPQVLAIPAVVGLALLVLPLVALVFRVEWSTLWQRHHGARVRSPHSGCRCRPG